LIGGRLARFDEEMMSPKTKIFKSLRLDDLEKD